MLKRQFSDDESLGDLSVFDLGGKGPSLLLCHATGFHALVLKQLASHLRRDFHIFALDMRAQGDSLITAEDRFAEAEGRLNWLGYANDILEFAQHLHAPLYGFGHSAGGAGVVLAEATRPNTFTEIFLFEPVLFPKSVGSQNADPLAQGARRRRDHFESLSQANMNFSQKPPMSKFEASVVADYVNHGLFKHAGEFRLKCRPNNEAEMYKMGSKHNGFESLAKIGCSTTIAYGNMADDRDHNPVFSSLTKLQAAQSPTIERTAVEGVGHFGPMESPLRVAAAVRAAFLN